MKVLGKLMRVYRNPASLKTIALNRYHKTKMALFWVYHKHYWRTRQSDGFNRLYSVFKNKKVYFSALANALFYKLLGRKVVAVFFLHASHWEFVKFFLPALKKKSLHIQIFGSFPDKLKSEFSCFSMQSLKPSLIGIPYVPSLVSDLYLTPASTTVLNTPKSPKIIFLHSLISIYGGVYEENTFDHYDYIFCAGKHHIEDFQAYFAKRGLKGTCLIPGGYPKLDEIIQRNQVTQASNERTILIAPTFISPATIGASLLPFAQNIIASLLKNNWRVIFRPHPLNMDPNNLYSEQMRSIREFFLAHPGFEMDLSKDYFETYRRASILVSDISGTAYTFAFGFTKPTVFIENGEDVFRQGLLYQGQEKIGATIKAQNIDSLPHLIEEVFSHRAIFEKQIVEFRNQIIFNVLGSSQYFLDNIHYLFKSGVRNPDWIYL